MANIQQKANGKAPRVKKLILGDLFTDAPVRSEPEEPQKIVVAGLAEARPVKEYPDTFFGRAAAVFRGEFSTLFRSSLYFIAFTLPFIVIFAWFSGYFEDMILGGSYNFMGDIGVGYPGGGDSIAQSVASLYWDVKAPVFAMLAATLIIGSLGLSGLFYCAKRSYYQNYYKRITKTYWMGFAKYWWKFLVTATVAVLIGLAMAVALIYLLQQQTLGTADAGAYCAVIFSWIFGAPLLSVPLVMMSLFASYDLTFAQTFKNALVIIANAPVMVALVGILSVAPLLLCLVSNIFGIIVYIVMALVGATFMALGWTAMADRGMTKCRNRKAENDKVIMQVQRQEAKKKAKQGGNNPYANNSGDQHINYAPKKKVQPQKPYQNPKKKKKKK